MLRDLEIVQRYMQKITYSINGDKLNNDAFHAQAGLLAQEIINMMDMFRLAMEMLYDRCKQA
jgi:hypothetical protein